MTVIICGNCGEPIDVDDLCEVQLAHGSLYLHSACVLAVSSALLDMASHILDEMLETDEEEEEDGGYL